MAIIYAFGDSITYGAWGIKSSGWANLLRQHLDDLQEKNPEYYCLFYNLGIPGETTEGLLNRFDNETNARVKKNEESIFIFAFGANDAVFSTSENKFRVSKDEYENNLSKVLEKAGKISKKILLVNILPVVESMNNGRNGKTRNNQYMEEYNLILQKLANRFELKLVDVNSVFMKAGYEKLFVQEDGLHPNDEGHQLIFETIKPVLQEMIGWE